MAEIRRRYGDHLYAKHDYDAAMGQYCATIGFMEPSYVIRKFLDAQRIHNLTSYLEELHSQASFYHSFKVHSIISEFPQIFPNFDLQEGWQPQAGLCF